jgi:hypothetical protein
MFKVGSYAKDEDKKGENRSAVKSSAPPPATPSVNMASAEMVMYCYDVLLCYFAGVECPELPQFRATGEL